MKKSKLNSISPQPGNKTGELSPAKSEESVTSTLSSQPEETKVVSLEAVPETEQLSDKEVALRNELEKTIRAFKTGFFDTAKAFHIIRSQKLYRSTHATYENYCKGVHGWSVSNGKRMADAGARLEILAPIGAIPKNEHQVRLLSPVPIDSIKETWQLAVDKADGKTVTTNIIKDAVTEVCTKKGIKLPSKPITPTTTTDTSESIAVDDRGVLKAKLTQVVMILEPMEGDKNISSAIEHLKEIMDQITQKNLQTTE